MGDYEEVGLPGAVGSMDVVHVKWSNCLAGDFNRAKGKESYPSLAFQCISDYRLVLAKEKSMFETLFCSVLVHNF